jgi:hypothetical protein
MAITRDEAIQLVTNCTINSYDYSNLKYAVDKIYNDFESRDCNNCRHFQKKINEEEIACNYHCGFYPLKYKYCGHWESKDNTVENFSKMVHRDD